MLDYLIDFTVEKSSNVMKIQFSVFEFFTSMFRIMVKTNVYKQKMKGINDVRL